MGTAQSQHIGDVNFNATKQSKRASRKEAQRIALYNKKLRKGRESRVNSKQGSGGKHDGIAIADLMSYLKVVAAHASNLPLTTRDDPELGRTVSSLTAEEYAMKSKVFFPSDIRVIGGSSLKYNGHWVYPNKRNFDLSGSITESNHTRGGACCNAMLKALYDNENDDTGMMEHHDISGDVDLFDENDDDDDDDDDDDATIESMVFDDIDVQNGPAQTWAGMLRNMKDEMEELGCNQVPTVSTSRRFELNEPFSLLPNSFDPNTNKKIALLIGCNYLNSSGEISTSHEDVQSMKDYIVNVHGFSDDEDSMTILIDDGEHSAPSKSNIIRAFEKITKNSKEGDAVLIQFVGHGTRLLDTSVGVEVDCYEEVIFPSDYNKAGAIPDTMIFKSLLAPLAKDVTVTILLDSIDTGVMLDMPYSWSTMYDNTDVVAKLSLNDDFSFVRFLKVLKQMYEASTYSAASLSQEYDGELGYDSDSVGDDSLCTDDGDGDGDSEDEDDDDESDEEDNDNKSAREGADDDQIGHDFDDNNSFVDDTNDTTIDTLDKSNMTTIGGHFKPPTGLRSKRSQPKVGSMKPPTGLLPKSQSPKNQADTRDTDNSNRGNSGGTFNKFTRSLSAQNIFKQFMCGQTEEIAVDIDSDQKIVTNSAAFYEDNNDDYFVQDSYSDDRTVDSAVEKESKQKTVTKNASFYDDNNDDMFVQDSYSDDGTISGEDDDYS